MVTTCILLLQFVSKSVRSRHKLLIMFKTGRCCAALRTCYLASGVGVLRLCHAKCSGAKKNWTFIGDQFPLTARLSTVGSSGCSALSLCCHCLSAAADCCCWTDCCWVLTVTHWPVDPLGQPTGSTQRKKQRTDPQLSVPESAADTLSVWVRVLSVWGAGLWGTSAAGVSKLESWWSNNWNYARTLKCQIPGIQGLISKNK